MIEEIKRRIETNNSLIELNKFDKDYAKLYELYIENKTLKWVVKLEESGRSISKDGGD